MSDLSLNMNKPKSVEMPDTAPLEAQEPSVQARKPFFTPGTMFLIFAMLVFGMVIAVALLNQNRTQPTGGPAPDFRVTTFFDDQTFKLSDLKGKVVVLNFWASWCEPCKAEAPELQSTWERYQSNENVVFLGIAYADNGPRSMEFIQDYGITYLNAPDKGTVISEDYRIQGVPETFIIDQNGNISQFIYAGVTEAQLVPIIDHLLAEGDPT